MDQSESFQAVQLLRSLLEHIYGNIGILKFNIEELNPSDSTDEVDSTKWNITCTFYESLGSIEPSRYKATVDIKNKRITLNKISGPESSEKIATNWTQSQKVKKKSKKK